MEHRFLKGDRIKLTEGCMSKHGSYQQELRDNPVILTEDRYPDNDYARYAFGFGSRRISSSYWNEVVPKKKFTVIL